MPYFRWTRLYHENVEVAAVTAHSQPIPISVESNRVDRRKLVSPPNFLDILTCFSIKDSDLDSFFWSGCKFFPVRSQKDST